MRALCLVFCCLFASALFAADEKTPAELQSEAIKKLKAITEEGIPALRARVRARVSLASDLKDCVDGKAFIVPASVEPQALKVGDICVPYVHKARVWKIVDATTAIVRVEVGTNTGLQERELRLENFPTKDLTTDQEYRFGYVNNKVVPFHVIYIHGTEGSGSGVILRAQIIESPQGTRWLLNGFRI